MDHLLVAVREQLQSPLLWTRTNWAVQSIALCLYSRAGPNCVGQVQLTHCTWKASTNVFSNLNDPDKTRMPMVDPPHLLLHWPRVSWCPPSPPPLLWLESCFPNLILVNLDELLVAASPLLLYWRWVFTCLFSWQQVQAVSPSLVQMLKCTRVMLLLERCTPNITCCSIPVGTVQRLQRCVDHGSGLTQKSKRALLRLPCLTRSEHGSPAHPARLDRTVLLAIAHQGTNFCFQRHELHNVL